MSDAYLPMLLADIQKAIADLTLRVEAIEDAIASLDDVEVGGVGTYMDGTPIR